MEAEEAQENSKAPNRVSRYYAKGATPHLCPLLLEELAKQEEEDDDDDWTPHKAAGVCIMLLAQCVGDDVIPCVLPFFAHFQSNNWKYKEAAIMAFGSIHDSHDSAKKSVCLFSLSYQLQAQKIDRSFICYPQHVREMLTSNYSKSMLYFLILKSIVSCGYAVFLSQQHNDWEDIHYELAFLVGSIILAAIWMIALFKDDRHFYFFTSIVSIIPYVFAVVGFISVLLNRIYVYKDIFIDIGIDEDDIPFYSLLLAFIRIVLWCIPTVTFHRLWTLEKSSPVPNAVYKPGTLLTPI